MLVLDLRFLHVLIFFFVSIGGCTVTSSSTVLRNSRLMMHVFYPKVLFFSIPLFYTFSGHDAPHITNAGAPLLWDFLGKASGVGGQRDIKTLNDGYGYLCTAL